MIKKFAGTSIWSEDLNNLLPFYRDVLGLKVIHESEGFVVLGEGQSNWPTLGLGTHSECMGIIWIRRGIWWHSKPTTSPETGSG